MAAMGLDPVPFFTTIKTYLPQAPLSLKVRLSLSYEDFQENAKMTVQIADKITFNGVKYPLYPRSPLSEYLRKRFSISQVIRMLPSRNTAMQRGYVAYWEVENDTLFLLTIVPQHIFDKLFSSPSAKIEASWFSGTLYIPHKEQDPLSDLPEFEKYSQQEKRDSYSDFPSEYMKYSQYLAMEFLQGKLLRSTIVDQMEG